MGLLSSIGKIAGVASDVLGVGSTIAGFFGPSEPSTREVNANNYAMQKEFAQNGIRWKVEDAKAAGLHPLAALGSQGLSPTPSFVGGSGPSLSEKFSAAGNSLARSQLAGSTEGERLSARLLETQIEGQEIDNMAKASELARTTGAQMNPPFPGSIDGIQVNPSEITRSRRDLATELAGPAPAAKEFINRDGTVSVWPSKDAKASIEDSPYELEHMYRNRILPALSDKFYEYVYEPYSRFKSNADVRKKILRSRF